MNRKQTIIIVSIILVILLGIGAYFFFAKKAPTPGGPGTFPGGSGPGPGKPGTPPPGGEEPFVPGAGASLPRLYELHKKPVAAVGFAEQTVGKSKTFFARFIERGVGHIFETDLTTYFNTRISSETHLGVSEAFFANKGRSLIIRFTEEQDALTIKTRSIALGPPTAVAANTGAGESTGDQALPTPEEMPLPDHIPFMAVALDGADKLFYLENSPTSARGTVATVKGFKPSSIFTSSFTEWLPEFPNENLVTLTTRPSEKIPGHFFFLDPKSQVLKKVIDNVNGLTTSTNRDGKFVLYSETKNGMPNLSVYDIAKQESRALPLNTLPEKCAWSTKNVTVAYCAIPQYFDPGKYPDQWYQGTVGFSDVVWKVNAKTGITEKVFAPSVFNAPEMDMIDPVVSSDDTYLLFINKKTLTPWVYRLTEDQIITTPIATPTPGSPSANANPQDTPPKAMGKIR